MYNEYFGFKESPFSIAPDPHYLYMTAQHREALAHLVYGLNNDGGCILLTGEVGTGKTTICRCLLEQIPEHANIALLLNPKVTAVELLETICDEFKIPHFDQNNTVKTYIDLINTFLLDAHARNKKTVLIIDEAQNLDSTVLEQLRLLTNLETNQRKLLQIVILGQPELLDILSQEKMRQLAQRITARFHLKPLSRDEIKAYVSHRLAIAGQNIQLFPDSAIKRIYQISKGIPRLINIICDRALLGAYVQNKPSVDIATLNQAAKEIFGELKNQPHHYSKQKNQPNIIKIAAVFFIISIALSAIFYVTQNSQTTFFASAEKQEEPDKQVAIQSSQLDNLAEPTESTNTPNNEAPAIDETLTFNTKNTDTPIADNSALEKLIENSTNNKAAAYSYLFQLWQLNYALNKNGNACTYAVTQGLSCLRRSGNLHSLRQLNRPAVITLYTRSGENRFATLTKLDTKFATINTSTEELTIELATLDAYWFGDYTLLWQKPPYYQGAVKPGNNGPIVQWLDQQLVRIYGNKSTPIISDTYTEELITQVKTFQQSKGLLPDGIAGPRTLIHLNNELGLQAPQLSTSTNTRES